MRFLFVDQIIEQTASTVKGSRYFSAGEPFRYAQRDGAFVIAPGVISEAIGQLASWKCINENNYTARPVFLFADEIEAYLPVSPDSLVELEADVHEANEETFRFSGRALVNGSVVQVIRDCSGYFMPLAELEDPEITKQRYKELVGEGLKLPSPHQVPYNFFDLVTDVTSRSDDSLTANVALQVHEPFYADHFPRMPVTPIVVINELIGAVSNMFQCGERRRCLTIKHIAGIKIRNFVRPGDQLEVKVTRKRSASNDPTLLETVVDVSQAGKRILRGNYTYIIEEAL